MTDLPATEQRRDQAAMEPHVTENTRRARRERSIPHQHIGDPCIICSVSSSGPHTPPWEQAQRVRKARATAAQTAYKRLESLRAAHTPGQAERAAASLVRPGIEHATRQARGRADRAD